MPRKNLTATSRTASEAFGPASEICWKGRLSWSDAGCVFLKQIVQAPSPDRTGISVFPEDGSTRGIAVGSPQTWFITLAQDHARPTIHSTPGPLLPFKPPHHKSGIILKILVSSLELTTQADLNRFGYFSIASAKAA